MNSPLHEPDENKRAVIARNKTTDTDTLIAFAYDPSSMVRFWTALNPSTPTSVISMLTRDDSDNTMLPIFFQLDIKKTAPERRVQLSSYGLTDQETKTLFDDEVIDLLILIKRNYLTAEQIRENLIFDIPIGVALALN